MSNESKRSAVSGENVAGWCEGGRLLKSAGEGGKSMQVWWILIFVVGTIIFAWVMSFQRQWRCLCGIIVSSCMCVNELGRGGWLL